MSIVGRGADQCMIRLPDGMRDEIAAAAKANGRSMNSEIVARLSVAGPAATVFPTSATYKDKSITHGGLKLRQWYAGQALPSVIGACSGDAYQIATYPTPAAYFAAKAFEVADAMIAFEAAEGGAA